MAPRSPKHPHLRGLPDAAPALNPIDFQHGNSAEVSRGEQKAPHYALPSPSKDITAIIIIIFF